MKSHYISRNKDLDRCLTHLRNSRSIAVDLEFDKNRFRYGFNLCLVQICSGRDCYLIDPLSGGLDVGRLFPILEDDQIQKVVFAFGEDLRLLHSLDCFPRNLFDLDIATSLLNYPPASLSSLLTEVLDIETGKSSQKSNWFNRPLSAEQKKYAVMDVLHLEELKQILLQEADQKNITDWIMEENNRLNKLNFAGTEDNNFIKNADKNGMTEFEWHLFKKLLEFRELLAKKHNKPSYQMIRKEYLEEISKDPDKLDQWKNTRGIYKGIKNQKIQKQFWKLIKDSSLSAEQRGLSKINPAIKPLSREEYLLQKNERSRINRIKRDILKPIKNRIAEDYGQDAASFMLSNRIINNMISGKIENLENYKKELIIDYAKELNQDLSTIYMVVD